MTARGAAGPGVRPWGSSAGSPGPAGASRSELVTGIAELMTQHAALGTLHDAALVLEDSRIAWVGPGARAPAADRRTDVGGRAVLPGWVDSHTHLVFDGDRSAEFAARMAGEPYAAGGIAVTTAETRAASDDRLRSLVAARVRAAAFGGTTYLETKTGYGLTVAGETRSAAVAAALVDEVTFLGAHLVPAGTDAEEYTDLVCGPMLQAVAPHARWVDVFCERGAFTPEQARRVLEAGRSAGLGLRVHGNQLGPGEGVRLAVELGAASVDHCNYLSDEDVDALAGSQTVATVLPACDLSTRAPLAPARRLLDAGATVAIASNCNPGTSYTSSMNFCVATAVLQMGLSIDEAVRAATWGGAQALRRADAPSGNGAADGIRTAGARRVPATSGGQDRTSPADSPPVGSIAVGHRADLHVLDAPAAIHLAYRPGMPLTWGVWRAAERVA